MTLRRRRRQSARPSALPVRAALVQGSALLPAVEDGLAAVARAHASLINEPLRPSFSESLDLDAALRAQYPNDNRWDYLLGYAPSGSVIGLEPHSARDDEIGTVIAKREAALVHLRDHLRSGAQVERWLWVASGEVHFAATEKTNLRLDQNGITFVGRRVLARHLSDDHTGTRRR